MIIILSLFKKISSSLVHPFTAFASLEKDVVSRAKASGSDDRSIRIGQFGNLEVYVADPYSIALSKLDRDSDTDLEDIVFLIQHDFVALEELERITHDALPRAREFDMNPNEVLAHLQELKKRLK